MNYFKDLLKNLDGWLVVMPLSFCAISILMLESTAYDGSFVLNRTIKVQIAAYAIGLVCLLAAMAFNYTKFEKVHWWIYGASLLFLLTVYIPGLGSTQYGSRAWLHLGPVYLQPAEIVKLTFTLCYANFLSRHQDALKTWKGFFVSIAYVLPFLFVIIVLQNDLGNALVLLVAAIFMLFAAGLRGAIFWTAAGSMAAAVPLAVHFLLRDHQKERITAFLHPEDLTLAGNYQVWNSKVAIGSGGLLGKGLFQGTQKTLKYLPVADSDFIFSVICEEFGFVGGAAVIALYAFFLSRIFRVSKNAKDLYGSLIVIGLFGMFLFQVFENIGMTMGLMPVTGITLPFISSGGTSILTNMIAVGLVLNVNIRSKAINF